MAADLTVDSGVLDGSLGSPIEVYSPGLSDKAQHQQEGMAPGPSHHFVSVVVGSAIERAEQVLEMIKRVERISARIVNSPAALDGKNDDRALSNTSKIKTPALIDVGGDCSKGQEMKRKKRTMILSHAFLSLVRALDRFDVIAQILGTLVHWEME
eukprot:jgi/Picre1/27136/NNA_000106.t1